MIDKVNGIFRWVDDKLGINHEDDRACWDDW